MSSRQFYIMVCIGVLSMKMQKLPGLVYDKVGKDGWLIFLMYLLINVALIFISFFVIKRLKAEKLLSPAKNKFFCIVRRVLLFIASLYFLSQALLLYEHIQALFANTLFDNLSWALFSLFLLFAVYFLAYRGIENIALNYEIYCWVILGSFLLIAVLGFGYTDFSVVLPIQTINFKNIISSISEFSFWFGDALLILILGLKSKNIKLSKTLLVYILSMIFMTVLVVEFYGMYGDYSVTQAGLISVLSGQSLLGLNIGRIDWFLILFAEIGAILTCSIYLYYSNTCAKSVFPKFNSFVISLIIIVVLYCMDVFYFVDMSAKIDFFKGFLSHWVLVLQLVVVVLLFILSLKQKSDSQNKFKPQKKRGLS